MPNVEIKLKEGAELNLEDVANIACVLKSLAVYTSMACEQEDSPEELQQLVDQGLKNIVNLFELEQWPGGGYETVYTGRASTLCSCAAAHACATGEKCRRGWRSGHLRKLVS